MGTTTELEIYTISYRLFDYLPGPVSGIFVAFCSYLLGSLWPVSTSFLFVQQPSGRVLPKTAGACSLRDGASPPSLLPEDKAQS